MTIYILDRSDSAKQHIMNKDTNSGVFLYEDVYDTGVENHAIGSFLGGSGDQIAFALLYDITKDKDLSIEKYKKLSDHLARIVPETVEISSADLLNLCS